MARKPATAWLQKAEAAEWLSIVEARQAFPQVDFITGTGFTCFNIGANFRLIVIVS